MPMPRDPPPIPAPNARRNYLGLSPSLAAVPRGWYADVIVQLVSTMLGDRSGTPCLIVWDGSEWDHEQWPLYAMDDEERKEEIPADPEIKEKSRGRTVTVFCYDYDEQCVQPIRSGDWLYLENVHCGFSWNSRFASFMMHKNARRRHIWRLEQPMADGLFYEKEWREALQRTASAAPLSPEAIQAGIAARSEKPPAVAQQKHEEKSSVRSPERVEQKEEVEREEVVEEEVEESGEEETGLGQEEDERLQEFLDTISRRLEEAGVALEDLDNEELDRLADEVFDAMEEQPEATRASSRRAAVAAAAPATPKRRRKTRAATPPPRSPVVTRSAQNAANERNPKGPQRPQPGTIITVPLGRTGHNIGKRPTELDKLRW